MESTAMVLSVHLMRHAAQEDVLMELVKPVETTMKVYAMENNALKIKIVYHKLANLDNAFIVLTLYTVNTVITFNA
jgi:uncharacterized coiled-coil protein SlyX